jgi:hypothetical protein
MNTPTVLLIVHGLLAVALLGAITHQVVSVWLPARGPAGSFVGRFRAVSAPSYANAIVALYVLTFVLGGFVYAYYRIEVRMVVEQLGLWAQNGSFELKEHFAAVGLAILPAYWHYWRQPPAENRTRAILTALLAFIVWWNFIVGHILNNIRGFGA